MSPPFTRSSVFRDFERGLSAGAADVVVFMSYMTGWLLLDVELHGRVYVHIPYICCWACLRFYLLIVFLGNAAM